MLIKVRKYYANPKQIHQLENQKCKVDHSIVLNLRADNLFLEF